MIPGDGWEYDIAPDQMPNLDISGNEGLPTCLLEWVAIRLF